LRARQATVGRALTHRGANKQFFGVS